MISNWSVFGENPQADGGRDALDERLLRNLRAMIMSMVSDRCRPHAEAEPTMKSFLAVLAAATFLGAVASSVDAAVYYYRGHPYAYRWHGHYYHHRRCYWNGVAHVCRYY